MSRPLWEEISELLQRWIESGKLVQGARLVEEQLAQELGVSRGPVREALKDLRAKGLVSVKRRRGTFVTELSPEVLWEVHSLRLVLEPFALRLAMERNPEQLIRGLTDIVEKMRAAHASGDHGAAVRLDGEFHTKLVQSSGHGLLINVYEGLASRIRMAITLHDVRKETIETIIKEHAELLAAVDEGDVEAACDLLRAHLHDALKAVEKNRLASERRHPRNRTSKSTQHEPGE